MTTVNVYRTFKGNCEEAFNFYKSVFGGEFPYLGRYKDIPPIEGGKTYSHEEGADRLFNGLSAGGFVTIPMNNTFWGDYFGMWTDKFGISWMISFAMPDHK